MTTQTNDSNQQSQPMIEQIIAGCLQGHQGSFTELYDLFGAGIYRLCYSILLNQQDAEDITQETFVYAFRNIHRYDSKKAQFKTWLYTIAVSRCKNTFRRKHMPVLELGQIIQLGIPAPTAEQPENAVAQQDIEAQISTALSQLSPMVRTAVVLRYGHQLTFREIAEVTDCPQKTAESRVRLAHNQLRKLLEPVGYGLLEELLNIG